MRDWVGIWGACIANIQGSFVHLAWPSGRSLLAQDNITVEMFALITDEAYKVQAEALRHA